MRSAAGPPGWRILLLVCLAGASAAGGPVEPPWYAPLKGIGAGPGKLELGRDAWYWVNGRRERRDPTGRAGRNLGHELNLIARWQVTRELELLCGYARFFAGDFPRNTPGSHRDADWAFAQMTYLL